MPNWCHNSLAVSGPPEELQSFAEQVRGEEQPLSFAALVPEPAGLLERPMLGSETFNPDLPDAQLDWYGWRVRHWGTKWEARFEGPAVALGDSDAQVGPASGHQQLGSELHYGFYTAWSPPMPWLLAASRHFPQLTLELQWAEPGADAAGRYGVRDGQVLAKVDLEVDQVLPAEERWY